MAGIIKKAMNQINPPKQKHSFMHGLKDWALSPGGIATILLGIGLFLFIEYKTSDKKKA